MNQIMKRFFIFVLLLSVYSTIYAQTVVNKYNQAFWNGNAKTYEDKAYEACVSINEDKVQSIVIQIHSGDKNVKLATVMLKYISDRDNLIKSLKSIRNKFRYWISTAETNKVRDFSKKLTDIYDMPQMTVAAILDDGKSYINEQFFLKPYFCVDKEGRINLVMAGDINLYRYTPSKYNAADVIKDFSLMTLFASAIPTKEYLRFHNLGFSFSSVEQLQSLIDALDNNKNINEMIQKNAKEKMRKDSIDKLFR